jgi:adenylate cyclase class IV
MSLEIEYRAQLTEDEFDALTDRLRQRGEDLGPDNKHIWFYVLPDKLLKVVHNISHNSGKIVIKTNRIGSGSAFPEVELSIDASEVPAAIEIFRVLGYAQFMHDAYNQRHNWRYGAVEIALKRSEAWGPHAEFEVVVPDGASPTQIDDANQLVRSAAEDLGVRLMTELELADFTRQFEAKQARKVG